ncbi:rRNA methyltransferase 3, mitochondrial-like [Patiria miniata]|uniref:RNA 2-O ribose methyltransferase substrate binding domain-containing protein n=1 Tax=Patiria miniata TaxID=46514 RepID=A0A914A5K8_PATMI|nr:rRNA methyltransferase 3, mitochondrial-like [Patiria miniata]
MAAPMRSAMLILTKVSTPTNARLREFILKPPLRNFTVTSANMVRGVRRPQIKARQQNRRNIQRDEHEEGLGTELASEEDTVNSIPNAVAEILSKKTIMNNSKAATEDRASKLKYEKAGVDDKRIGRLMMLVKSRKARQQTGRVMLEGRRLITDAIESGLQAHTIFFSRLENLEGIPVHKTQAALIKVPFNDIAMWSDVVTTQGVIGVFRKPTHTSTHQSESLILPLTLICDNIREPGNLGTILRSAVAAQCEQILLTKGCVDLWEPKVLRSGAGAHFRMPIIANIPWKELPNYVGENVTVHVADNNVSGEEYSTRSSSRKSPRQVQKQRKWNQHLESDEDVLDLPPVLESKMYHEVDWRVKSALVIGGETEGLSDAALDMCDTSLGYRVHIPMPGSTESLNSAVSASVIIFEALRQNLTAAKT